MDKALQDQITTDVVIATKLLKAVTSFKDGTLTPQGIAMALVKFAVKLTKTNNGTKKNFQDMVDVAWDSPHT